MAFQAYGVMTAYLSLLRQMSYVNMSMLIEVWIYIFVRFVDLRFIYDIVSVMDFITKHEIYL